MQNSVTLYDIKREDGNWFRLTAYLSDGELKLEAHDFCELAESMFGDSEHETFYMFDSENTQKLLQVLETDNLLEGLQNFFGGQMKDRDFFELCKKNGVMCTFTSWS